MFDKHDYFSKLKLLEAVVRERLNTLDDFNRRAPHVRGLTLRINGEPFPWPVDTERHRVLLAVVMKSCRRVEDAPRITPELQAELDRDFERMVAEAEAIVEVGSQWREG